MEFDYKNVDWKLAKEEWDKSPIWFNLIIRHGENILTFQPYLDKTKRYKLGLYINGWMKGEWYQDDCEFQKYFRTVTIKPYKETFELHRIRDKKCKKMTDAQIMKYKGIKLGSYRIPGFDNIAQIKKMVTALD